MSTPKPSQEVNDSIIINSEACIYQLTTLLGNAKLLRLVELLKDVIDETGYGDVKIVVAEGKVQMLKAEHSYK